MTPTLVTPLAVTHTKVCVRFYSLETIVFTLYFPKRSAMNGLECIDIEGRKTLNQRLTVE